MAQATKIEWTDATWNPLRGCSEISPGCAQCYAAGIAARFSGPGQPYEGLAYRDARGKAHWTGRVRIVPEKLSEPLSWRKPHAVFVNSMSDLFHEDVSNEYIAAVFGVMAAADHHTFQVLTKRAARLPEWFAWVARETAGRYIRPALAEHAACQGGGDRLFEAANRLAGRGGWPLPNVWLGVSCEDQATADERIPHLLKTPATVRFLSCEPLLGPVNLDRVTWRLPDSIGVVVGGVLGDTDGRSLSPRGAGGRGIGWVIGGFESGPNARPGHPDWARSLRDQCQASGVPFFWKQHGEWRECERRGDVYTIAHVNGRQRPTKVIYRDGRSFDYRSNWDGKDDGVAVERVGKKAAGRLLDGRVWDEFPEVRAAAAAV